MTDVLAEAMPDSEPVPSRNCSAWKYRPFACSSVER